MIWEKVYTMLTQIKINLEYLMLMSYKAVQNQPPSKNVFTSENIAGLIYMGQWWNIYLSIPIKQLS